MKTLFSLFFCLFLSVHVFGQATRVINANKSQIEDFFKSKTMIVMDANPMIGYNIVVTDAVKKYWTLTPYEIITSDQFDEMYTDPSLSFVFLSKIQLEKDKEEVYYLYINFVMGAKVKDITQLPELLSLPLAYTGVDEDSYVDKLPLMLRFAQIHINNLKDAKNPRTFYILKNYGKDSKELKNKTLLVKESDLSEEVDDLDKIKKYYSGPVKIVTEDEIVKAVEDKVAATAVLHQIGPGEDDNTGRSYRLIFGTDDARLYYYYHQNITQKRPAGMLAWDFQQIEK